MPDSGRSESEGPETDAAQRRRPRPTSWAKRLRPFAVLLLPGILTFIPGCAETFLLHPSTRPINGAKTEVLPGLGLQVAAASAGDPSLGLPSAAAFLGNASRAEFAAPRWAGVLKGLVAEVDALNYPGFGESAGEADLSEIVPTSVAFDRLVSHPILLGNSLGSAVSLAVAARRTDPPKLVVLQNVPPLDELVLIRHGWWNLWLLAIPIALQIPSELDAIENAKQCTGPAIFLSANNDRTVPPDYQQDVIDAYAGPKTVIRYDGGHNARLPREVVEKLREAVVGYLEE